MREMKKMIQSAPTEKDAKEMLRMWHSFGKITSEQLKKGYELVKKEFAKD